GNPIMQRIWAWTQCVAIDASVPGTLIRTFGYSAAGEKVKTLLYGLLSALLLFTAAIVSNIESVQQTLNLTLDAAYLHVFIPVEALIWIRSIAIVLLIVAHALRHVHRERSEAKHEALPASPPAPLVVTPELLDALRALQAQTTVSEEAPTPYALPFPQGEQEASKGEQRANIAQKATGECDDEQMANNYERVKTYLAVYPNA